MKFREGEITQPLATASLGFDQRIVNILDGSDVVTHVSARESRALERGGRSLSRLRSSRARSMALFTFLDNAAPQLAKRGIPGLNRIQVIALREIQCPIIRETCEA